MSADMKWVRDLLSARSISPERLYPYLMAYRDAIDEVIGISGTSIINWLDARLAKSGSLDQ